MDWITSERFAPRPVPYWPPHVVAYLDQDEVADSTTAARRRVLCHLDDDADLVLARRAQRLRALRRRGRLVATVRRR